MSAIMLAAWDGKEAPVWLERPLTSERQHDPMPGRMRRSRWLWLAALCVAAGLLRVWNIDYGLPHDFHPDEPQTITSALSIVIQQDLNPHFFVYPALVFYLNALVYAVFFLAGKMVGFFPSLAEFSAFELLDHSVFILITRLLSGLFGTLSLLPVFVLGRHLGHAYIGLVAATLLAVSPLHVWNAHFGTVDVPLTFFILVATYFLYMSYSQQRQRDFVLLGSFAGLATATKYPAGLLLITCMLLSPLFTRKEEQPLWSPSFLFSPRSPLVLSVGAFIVSYSLAAPYTYLDFSTFWQEFNAHRQLFSQGWLGSEGISNFFGYYAKLLLVEEWGVFTGLLCLVGSGTLALQRPWLAFVLFTFPGLYYCVFGLSTTGFARYALPLVPTVALLAAYGLWQISRAGLLINPRVQAAILLGGTLIAAWPGVSQAIKVNEEFGKPDTRQLSQAWIEQHIPPGSRIFMEYYGPPLVDFYQAKAETTARQRLARLEIWRPWLSRNVAIAKPFYYVAIIPIADIWNAEAVAKEYYDWSRYAQSGVDYVISDSKLSSRYKAAAHKYPRQVAFYKALEQHCELVQTWNPQELNGTGPTIRLYRIPPTIKRRNFNEPDSS